MCWCNCQYTTFFLKPQSIFHQINKLLQIETTILNNSFLQQHNVAISMLRLDKIHATISGNKWFKLKLNLEFALENNYTTILTFGGAYSNHLHATALACKLSNIQCIGVIRGEEPTILNTTLLDCKANNMQLHFISRTTYNSKNEAVFIEELKEQFGNFYLIPEGGNNDFGLKGCAEIPHYFTDEYNIISTSVGTAITISGLLLDAKKNTTTYGFTAIKNGEYLNREVTETLKKNNCENSNFELFTNYHCGGFGKYNEQLTHFINEFYNDNNIELDFVYTAKMMQGLYDLIATKKIKPNTKILALHTGGLQGNRSIKHLLNFNNIDEHN